MRCSDKPVEARYPILGGATGLLITLGIYYKKWILLAIAGVLIAVVVLMLIRDFKK